MCFSEQAVTVIKNLNLYRIKQCSIHDLITSVCNLFDDATKEQLSVADYSFLRFISSEIGIPQYYELLCRKNKVYEGDYNLSDLLAVVQDSELIVDDDLLLHRYQKHVYDSFTINCQNRYFLSAPTSFGKTFVVYEIIKKMSYENVVLIFPTIALLGENYLKLLELKNKNEFWSDYHIHTLSDEDRVEGKNLWIYTPERFMSFIDKHNNHKFDFIFIDEIYKIDNQYIIDVETIGENERDISFRVALFDTCLRAKDILLAGPYISFPTGNGNRSLDYFLNDNAFSILNYNEIEIVNKFCLPVREKHVYDFDGLNFAISNKDKFEKLYTILEEIRKQKEGTIIYCGKKIDTERLAKKLIKNNISKKSDSADMQIFINHLSDVFGADWIVVNALKHGIGIHHGLVPKYIQREIISLFNSGDISILLSTTTITEGINTTAKNVIVMSNYKGIKALKHFDAQNIAGRAGRFNSHYTGRVISIDNDFMEILFEDGECLTHKSYDSESIKTDVDLEISKKEFLSLKDKNRKDEILRIVKESNIPNDIINSFKTVSKITKVQLFNKIEKLKTNERQKIDLFCKQLTYGSFNWDGFDVICNLLVDFVDESDLKSLMSQPISNGHVLLTSKVYFYLNQGIMGVIENEKTYYKKSTDSAVREAAKIIFNTFRYQLAKYLGIFDLLYRYCISKEKGINIDDAIGLSILIQLLEYGSLVDKAKKVNDYGVPYSIVKYYETEDPRIVNGFDAYEIKVFKQIKDIL